MPPRDVNSPHSHEHSFCIPSVFPPLLKALVPLYFNYCSFGICFDGLCTCFQSFCLVRPYLTVCLLDNIQMNPIKESFCYQSGQAVPITARLSVALHTTQTSCCIALTTALCHSNEFNSSTGPNPNAGWVNENALHGSISASQLRIFQLHQLHLPPLSSPYEGDILLSKVNTFCLKCLLVSQFKNLSCTIFLLLVPFLFHMLTPIPHLLLGTIPSLQLQFFSQCSSWSVPTALGHPNALLLGTATAQPFFSDGCRQVIK